MEILLQHGHRGTLEAGMEIVLDDKLAADRDDLLLGFTDHEIHIEQITENTRSYLEMLGDRKLGGEVLRAAGASILAAKREHQAASDILFGQADNFSEAVATKCAEELGGEPLVIDDGTRYEYQHGYLVKVGQNELPAVMGGADKFIDRQRIEKIARGIKGCDISKAYVRAAQGGDWITLLENLNAS